VQNDRDRRSPAAFIDASLWHGSLNRCVAILASHPEVAGSDIHSAAILVDDAAVRRFLESATRTLNVVFGQRDE
jgi:hypothetical protein